ncbi:MAG: BatA and WFA domain-containing protein [Abitibacteriaceae bacterium]|nr:BatA and WFA domain-containing protein [Abditibacteriaceae bacterium]
MSLIAPLNFLFAGLLGVVLLLYVLRLKRKERVISSTFLWHSALRDLQANAPWQRLRSSLLMWLQLAFLALAIFALVRPSIKVLAAGGQTIAIIMDASGSMVATDVQPSRFEQARSEAGRLINALSTGDQATVISSAAQTRVLAPLTADKNILKKAITSARTQDTGCNLREAIVLASSLLRGKQNPQIYVLSDGAVAPINDLSLGKVGLQFVRIGKGNENLAITAMDVRRGYGANTNPQIFVTASNFSSHEKSVNLELSHDNDLVEVRPMTIPAASEKGPGQQAQLFGDLTFQQGLFSVRFDADDDLKTDNAAYAVLSAPQNLKVLLLTNGNTFLENALNLDPHVQVFRTTPGDLAAAKAKGSYDVVVCDGINSPNLPDTNQLVFNTVTDLSPVTKVGVASAPSVADYDKKHPVTRSAPWNDVRFTQAIAAQLKPWGQAIVEGEKTPLIVAGEQKGRRVVWCGFDLFDTDLPMRVAFPIFVTNALRWLTAQRGATGPAEGSALRAGEMVPLMVPPGIQEITVTAPDKTSRSIPVSASPVAYDGADRVGVYTATGRVGKTDWKQVFAVNLLSKSESNLQPGVALKVENTNITAETHARANRELWGYITLAALALLGLEWWVYHRGSLWSPDSLVTVFRKLRVRST